MLSSSGDIVKNMKIFISKTLRFCKKLVNSLSKNMKIQKMAHFLFSQISYTSWTTEKYNTVKPRNSGLQNSGNLQNSGQPLNDQNDLFY